MKVARLVVARINTNLDKRSHTSCHWWSLGLQRNRDLALLLAQLSMLYWADVFFVSDLNHNTVTNVLWLYTTTSWWSQSCIWSTVYKSIRLRMTEAYSFITTWKCMLTSLEQTRTGFCLPFNPGEDNHKKTLLQIIPFHNLSICLIDSNFKQLNPATSLQQLPH